MLKFSSKNRASIHYGSTEPKAASSALTVAGRPATSPLPSYFGDHAAAVVANGFSCLPVTLGSKQINWTNWNFFCSEVPAGKQIALWSSKYRQHGLAIPTGWSAIAVDIDCLDVRQAKDIERLALRNLGNTPLKRIGQYPKRLLVYAVAPGHVIPSSSTGHVDLIGDNRYFVAFNLHPKTARPYRWVNESPATVPVAELPPVTPAQIERFMAEVRCHFGQNEASPAEVTEFQSNPPLSPQIHSSDVTTPRIMDGRDGLLTRLVWQAYARHDTPESIAANAWTAFIAQADLSRPKRDGRHSWSHADALGKARYAVTRRKPSPKLAINASPEVTPAGDWNAARARFARCIDRLCVQGELTRMDAAISHAMLAYVSNADRACFASCETLATAVGCRPSTVKKARRQLRAVGLWTARHTKGGRGILAHYRPRLDETNIPEGL